MSGLFSNYDNLTFRMVSERNKLDASCVCLRMCSQFFMRLGRKSLHWRTSGSYRLCLKFLPSVNTKWCIYTLSSAFTTICVVPNSWLHTSGSIPDMTCLARHKGHFRQASVIIQLLLQSWWQWNGWYRKRSQHFYQKP